MRINGADHSEFVRVGAVLGFDLLAHAAFEGCFLCYEYLFFLDQ